VRDASPNPQGSPRPANHHRKFYNSRGQFGRPCRPTRYARGSSFRRRIPRGRLTSPWEFVTGIRSWALPGLFAGLMELARIGGIPPENYLTVIYTFMDIMSLVPVACSFFWGFRAFGLVGATVVEFVNRYLGRADLLCSAHFDRGCGRKYLRFHAVSCNYCERVGHGTCFMVYKTYLLCKRI
jgi:hypothetical protein